MKTIIFTLITVAAFSIHLEAQEIPVNTTAPHIAIEPVIPVIAIDPVIVADTINQSADQDTSNIRIGNVEIEVIDHDHGTDYNWCNNKHRNHRSGKFDGHWEGIELGFNGFEETDYSLYDGNEFMALDQGKSLEVDVNFYQLNIALYKTYLGLVSGMGFSFNSYRFEDPYTLRRGTEMTEAVLLESENLSKTKLALSYFQVPLLFELQIPVNNNEGRVYINAGVIGGVRIGSHTKVKYGDDKEKDRSRFNINPFKYAATARVGYKDIGFFATYSLTPLFESGMGPELTPFTIGISFLN